MLDGCTVHLRFSLGRSLSYENIKWEQSNVILDAAMNGCNDSAYLNRLKPNIYINIFDIFYIGRTATRMMGWKLKVSVHWHLRVSLYADANNGGWRVEGTTRYVKPQVWVLFVHLIAARSFFKIVAVQILAWCCWMPAGATITTH